MKPRSCRLTVERLEDRCVPSCTTLGGTASGDFNNDGLVDYAELTSPTKVSVYLAKADGSYRLSDTLQVPKSFPISTMCVSDIYPSGTLDISALGQTSKYPDGYSHFWLGKGDGTFGKRTTEINNCFGCFP